MSGRFLYRRLLYRLLQINDTPESIALGASVGMWLAMTPTVGVQMILMIMVGTVIRANRLAGIVMVYISNPLTLLPIYWADYVVGVLVLDLDRRDREWFVATCERFLTQVETNGAWDASLEFLRTQGQIAWPMAVGGTVIGLIAAIPTYPITLRLVRGHQRRKLHRQSLATLHAVRRFDGEEPPTGGDASGWSGSESRKRPGGLETEQPS